MAVETMAAYAVILGLPAWLVIEAILSRGRQRQKAASRTRGRAVSVPSLDESIVISRDGVALTAEEARDIRAA